MAKQQMCQDQKSRKGPTQKNRFTRETGKDGNGDKKQWFGGVSSKEILITLEHGLSIKMCYRWLWKW